MNKESIRSTLNIAEFPFSNTTNHFTEQTIDSLDAKAIYYKRAKVLTEEQMHPLLIDGEGDVVFHLEPSRGSQVLLYRFNCLVGETVKDGLVDSLLVFYRAQLKGKSFAVAELQQVGKKSGNADSIVSLFPINGNLDESMSSIYASEILARIDIDPSKNFKSISY